MYLKSALLAGASVLAMTVHAHADPATLGSLVISAFLSVGAGSLLPVASAAAIGMTAIGAALTAANFAMNFFGGRGPRANPQDIKNTSKGAEAPGRHAFGRVRLGGESGFGNTAGYDIYRLLLQCFGKIVAVEEWFYDGRSITVEDNGDVSSPPWATPGGSNLNVKWKPGDGTETAWPDLVSSFSIWTENHRVRGIGQTLLKAINPGTGHARFPRLFQGGVKPLEAVARVGEFYDPRTATSAWTTNGVLICLHYFRRLPGMRDELIDFADIAVTAGRAEETVATKHGVTPRCQLSGGWKGPLTTDVVQDMLESAGLEVRTTADDKFTLRFLEDDPESEMTYTLRHILETYPQAGPEGVQRTNVCRLRYFAPQRNFEVSEIDLTDAPWARVPSEIDRYGEQEMVIDLVFCPDPSQAQRIARRLFHMSRADFGVVQTNFAGITARGLKTIALEVPDIGEDGGTALLKVRKGTARVNDGEGRVEIPFQIIPDVLKSPWNPATMEVDPPPAMPELQYESELDTPAQPAEAVQVIYPDNSREVRLRFAGVTGGTAAEATRRSYVGTAPNPWAAMTEYQASGNWYAWATANWEGQDADFRVRFFNVEEDGSNWSDMLQKRPLIVHNTPCSAPTEGETGWYSTDLRAVQLVMEAVINSGPWVEYHRVTTRPGLEHPMAVPIVAPNESDQYVYWRVAALTSDGTVGAYRTGTIHIPPFDTGP